MFSWLKRLTSVGISLVDFIQRYGFELLLCCLMKARMRRKLWRRAIVRSPLTVQRALAVAQCLQGTGSELGRKATTFFSCAKECAVKGR